MPSKQSVTLPSYEPSKWSMPYQESNYREEDIKASGVVFALLIAGGGALLILGFTHLNILQSANSPWQLKAIIGSALVAGPLLVVAAPFASGMTLRALDNKAKKKALETLNKAKA